MVSMTLDPNPSLQTVAKESSRRRVLVEEIDGLIKVYNDGQVERPIIMPCVTSSLAPGLDVTCRDLIIDKSTNIWARFYVPNTKGKLPLLVYFHGGGFCVGSASWSCYHEFLAKLSLKINCVIMSVNYRLCPENPLPSPYNDGIKALSWLRQQPSMPNNEWLTTKCDFSSYFLIGDSAGANIAYNVAIKLRSMEIKGLILIQPFFGGEVRTYSEKYMTQPPRSALTLAAADTYWRLSLPIGANRDHPWCNPVAKGAVKLADLHRNMPIMVCVAEMDILRDRNLEFCGNLSGAGQKVEHFVCEGVGHAFQILDKSPLAQSRVHELIYHVNNFISR